MGYEQLSAINEHERGSPKVNVFCAISTTQVYGPFFIYTYIYIEITVKGRSHLDMATYTTK